MGYDKIYLLGIDSNYVPVKNERRLLNGKQRLKVTLVPNRNYFFDGYQAKGDHYHISKKGRRRNVNHMQTFKKINEEFNKGGKARVVIAHKKSRLNLSKILPYEELPDEYLKDERKLIKWNEVTKNIIKSVENKTKKKKHVENKKKKAKKLGIVRKKKQAVKRHVKRTTKKNK